MAMATIEISKVFPYGEYQYSKQPVYEWNPKRIVGYSYSKKKIDEHFATNESEEITETEFESIAK